MKLLLKKSKNSAANFSVVVNTTVFRVTKTLSDEWKPLCPPLRIVDALNVNRPIQVEYLNV
jgi:hypothetical protein